LYGETGTGGGISFSSPQAKKEKQIIVIKLTVLRVYKK